AQLVERRIRNDKTPCLVHHRFSKTRPKSLICRSSDYSWDGAKQQKTAKIVPALSQRPSRKMWWTTPLNSLLISPSQINSDLRNKRRLMNKANYANAIETTTTWLT
ncbi:hypothetical protein, partial [Klebsiella pneumoniae]